jgi:hypothetical protein
MATSDMTNLLSNQKYGRSYLFMLIFSSAVDDVYVPVRKGEEAFAHESHIGSVNALSCSPFARYGQRDTVQYGMAWHGMAKVNDIAAVFARAVCASPCSSPFASQFSALFAPIS